MKHACVVTPVRMSPWFLLVLLALSPVACTEDEAGEGDEAKAGPLLGVLELPVSQRTADPAPAEAHDVQVSPSAVQVNGDTVGALAAGKLEGEAKSKLEAALKAPARSHAALSVHSQVPYATVVGVLAALRAAGVTDVSLKVRKPSGTETGWLALKGFAVGPKSAPDQEVEVAGAMPHTWADFTGAWEDVYAACGTSDSGNCAYKPEKIAEGGQLKLELYAAGQGVNVNFYRTGAPPPEAEPEGEAPPATDKPDTADPVADVENAPPATQALFQFRAKEAVKAPSAITATTAPLCGKRACGVVVRAEPATMFVRVVSLLGAAFPDGAAAPVAHFERP